MCYNNKAVGRKPESERYQEKFSKSLKKVLTNEKKCDIIDKSLREPDGSRRVQRKTIETAFQKNLKKGLTNERKCGIINKSSARRTLLKNGTAS